mmetsp:Transcript_85732/g.185053  ORF Transcript_85732/g.185053 Transcript_85732/m.185053 type:complete len:84 (+) Transcript_85732:622-873(+)|eukprot:CAMPEP_0116898392 /NCGR_PEP_ID=MMETSP0467-20121206/7119_1 /TAXON_ID=283647 /ORGANISM="Mesodinium pulex, Strain SPMC105" /LENGTH=83 /DNA_ID=CAMNT_0004570483 /DNA_START=1187 /DNA_END=1438 /DNA_ORIENTATION=-
MQEVHKQNILSTFFRHYDKDDSNSIDFREFKEMFLSNKITMSDQELSDLFDEIDLNDDKTISFQEFSEFMIKNMKNEENKGKK